MLIGKGITKNFGGLVALSGLDFEVRPGEVVGLIGPNGSGKTTLFNVISGFFRPDAGTIEFRGKRVDGLKTYEIAKMGIGRTFQIVKPLLAMTVLENVTVGVLYGRHGESEMRRARERSEEIIRFAGLEKKMHVQAGHLALAERKRLEIARSLGTRPEILLLDEVFAGLNQTEIEEAIELVRRIRDLHGVTIFIIEHVLKAIMRTCGRVIVIHQGRKIAEAPPREIVADRRVIEAYLGNVTDI